MSELQATNSVTLTQVEQAAWEQIAARSNRENQDQLGERSRCSENSVAVPRVADASGFAGEDRKDRSVARTSRTAVGRATPVGVSSESSARLLESGQKSVEEVPGCSQRRGGPSYELVRVRCRSRFCQHCCVPEGLPVKKKVEKVVETFKGTLFLTLTLDQTLHESPEAAYSYVQNKRCVGELVRTLKKLELLYSDRYFCVLEWQKNGWPHWHILLDADFIPIERVQARWDCFRPESAGPTEPGRPEFGFVFLTRGDFENRKHAADYACKYMLKNPENGYPAWVLDSRGEVKRYWTSKGFYVVEDLPRNDEEEENGGLSRVMPLPEPDEEFDDDENESGESVEEVQSTIRERLARCGHGTTLLMLWSANDGEGLKRSYMERWSEIDLEEACNHLKIEIMPNVRRVLLTFAEANEVLKWAAWRSGLIPDMNYDPFEKKRSRAARKGKEVYRG